MKNKVKLIIAFLLGAVIFGGLGVYASSVAASQITYKDTTVDVALNDLYTKALNTRELSTLLVVDGNNGAKSELNLVNGIYTKFKITNYLCYSDNRASFYTIDSTFNTRTDLTANTVYSIDNTYYRLFLEKTSGSYWCQVEVTFMK